VVAASLGLVLGQGLWFARGQNTNEEYYLGGRRMSWLIVGVSMFAATFSPLSFAGLPRAAAVLDILQWWYGAVPCLATIGFGLVGSLCLPPPCKHDVRGLLIAASRSVH
jgi:Na+/proline symporter